MSEQLILTGRLENLSLPLKELKIPSLENSNISEELLSRNQQGYIYQIPVSIDKLDITKPLSLEVTFQNGDQYILVGILIKEERELLELAERILQANDFTSCKAVCEAVLTTHPNDKIASALYTLLYEIFTEKSKPVTVIRDHLTLLVANLAHDALSCEGVAKLAQKYQQWDVALEYWNKCLSQSSQAQMSWLIGKGEVLIAAKRYAEAEAFFKAIVSHFPNIHLGYTGLGHVAQLQENWELALTHWDSCLQRFPNERGQVEGWLSKKSEALLALGRVEQTKSLLQEFIQVNPNSHFAYSKLIELEKKQSNWDKALEYANIRAEIFFDQRFYNELWNLLREQNKLNEAIQQYRTELIQKPSEFSLQVRLAGTLELQGDLEGALECYQQAKRLSPFPDWLLGRFVNVLVDLGKLRDAEAELRQKFAEPNQQVQLSVELANLAMRSNQFELALERWQQLKTSYPEYLSVLTVGEANALIGLNRLEQAKAIFEQLARDYPNNRVGLENLARLAARQGDFETALAHYDTCIVREPDNLWLKMSRANLFLSLKRLEEAKPVYEQFTEQFFDRHEGLQGLAKVARLSGNFELCLDYCRQLIARFPGLSIGYQEAEQTYIELGQFDQATQMFLANPSIQRKRHYNTASSVQLPAGLVLPEIIGKNNDYTFIEEKVKQFVESGQPYTLPVSIIIPTYNRKNLLAKTLAALTHQTYPKELIEVVVADDGSSDGVEEVIEKYKRLLDLQYVYQPDEGFRLSAVRNLGMKTAKHDHFIILDCDVLPVPQLVESYMRFFHVSDRVAMMGLRRFVCADALSDDDILENAKAILELPDIESSSEFSDMRSGSGITYDWRLPVLIKSDHLKNHKWAFAGFVGANMAHSRAAVAQVGGYDEDFRAWGYEDAEMGYRLHNAGYYFIPVMEAVVLHQEPLGGISDTDRQAGTSQTELLREEKCPVPFFRRYQKGRIYEVPKVSIYIPAYNAAKYIKDAVDSVLNQTYTDLEVCICDDGSTDNTLQILETNYTDNPRVRWVSQPNGGIGKASNTAVRLCRGMYIGQLDADDFLKPHAVELAVNYLDNHDVGCVYSSPEIVNADGNFVKLGYSSPFSREGLLYGMIVSHFRLFRKRDWMRTKGFDEELTNAVDYDMFLKLAEVCDFHHLDDVNYCYRHGENTSVARRKQQESNHFLVINRALQRMGLTDWEAVQADATNPRSVRLQRKNSSVICIHQEPVVVTHHVSCYPLNPI